MLPNPLEPADLVTYTEEIFNEKRLKIFSAVNVCIFVIYPSHNQFLWRKIKDSVKSVSIWSFSGPYFPAFYLNVERHSVFSPNAGKNGPEVLQIRTRFMQLLRKISWKLKCFTILEAFCNDSILKCLDSIHLSNFFKIQNHPIVPSFFNS